MELSISILTNVFSNIVYCVLPNPNKTSLENCKRLDYVRIFNYNNVKDDNVFLAKIVKLMEENDMEKCVYLVYNPLDDCLQNTDTLHDSNIVINRYYAKLKDVIIPLRSCILHFPIEAYIGQYLEQSYFEVDKHLYYVVHLKNKQKDCKKVTDVLKMEIEMKELDMLLTEIRPFLTSLVEFIKKTTKRKNFLQNVT